MKDTPAAVTIEINMPHVGGPDLVKLMRWDKRFSRIPIHVMTGERNARAFAEAILSGAVAFLPNLHLGTN